jgi:DNA-binding beta-propeller fold protein YncE
MKKLSTLILLAVFVLALPFAAHAGLEWRVLDETGLSVTPLDIDTSSDGQYIFILAQGKVYVYSVTAKREVATIPVQGAYDRLAYDEKAGVLVLSSSIQQTLARIGLENVFDVSTEGHPVAGPAGAPVLVAVFSDYQ